MSNHPHWQAESSGGGLTANVETLAQRVYDTLHEEIVTGSLQPGDPLVRRTLAKRLGVSPMPVTEALLRLEFDGLVESQPLYSSRVRTLSLEDVRNDDVLREAVECQAARQCAENASDDQLAKLLSDARTLDRLMVQADPRSKLGIRMHLELHADLARFGGCPRLVEELERVWFRRYMRLKWIEGVLHDYGAEDWHQQLIRAVGSRDPDVAEKKMREHVRYNQQHHLEGLQYLQKDGGPDNR